MSDTVASGELDLGEMGRGTWATDGELFVRVCICVVAVMWWCVRGDGGKVSESDLSSTCTG